MASLFAAPLQEPAAAQRPTEYEDILALYASGDETEALARLATWNESRVRAHVDRLRGVALPNSQVRTALLLHARREIQENLLPPKGEQVIHCRTGLHAKAIEYLSPKLLSTDPLAADFLRPLYLAMSRQALWSHCLGDSRSWARAGLKFFPRDGPLIMSVGIVSETEAFFTPAPAPSTPGVLPSIIKQRETAAMKLRSRLDTARGDYAAAVAAEPGLFEARLRLGRVLWRLGRPEAARLHFEGLIASSAPPGLRYLAHLFLGRILEDRSEAAEAERLYRAALELQPGSETAATALSHARFLQGDTESAREILADSLRRARPQIGVDPWVSYLVIQDPEGEGIIATLGRGQRP